MSLDDNVSKTSEHSSPYFEKGCDLVSGYDKLLASLYSALIAGVSLLLLRDPFNYWVGALFIIALMCFVLGIGHTLLHIAFHSKMLFLLDTIERNQNSMPTPLDSEEPTVEAYERCKKYAARAYGGQLSYLFLGVSVSGLAVLLHLWIYSSRAMTIIAVAIGMLLVFGIALRIWRKNSS